jgi:hypothetical protein
MSYSRSYAKDSLPPADDPRWEEWQKRPAIVRMMPLRGPCRIVTVDAPTDLPDGWEGWLAIDFAGHPYPLHKDVQSAMYTLPFILTEKPMNSKGDKK